MKVAAVAQQRMVKAVGREKNVKPQPWRDLHNLVDAPAGIHDNDPGWWVEVVTNWDNLWNHAKTQL